MPKWQHVLLRPATLIEIKDNWIMFNGRKTGHIYDGTYISVRNPKKHYYVLGRGYPISEEILIWLKKHNIMDIQIIEEGKKVRKFLARIDHYLDAPLIEHPPFEKQRSVPLTELEEIL